MSVIRLNLTIGDTYLPPTLFEYGERAYWSLRCWIGSLVCKWKGEHDMRGDFFKICARCCHCEIDPSKMDTLVKKMVDDWAKAVVVAFEKLAEAYRMKV